jgi:class 3 adenylate cyclase
VEAERRQVTVLFTDMVGFTSFSERSGEEAAYTLMRSLSKLMDEAVREQGGVVQGFTGDGIMGVFGAPVAFEDAPLRACRAALSILQRLGAAGPDFESKHGVQPQLRIGLNTGAAVVGQVQEGAGAGVTVLGDTVNFAARLQALAEPDSVFMSEAMHRLVQGMVEATFAGDHQIKGKAEPQKAYRLNALREGATRFTAAVSRGLSTFVGRERELEVLERALDKACSQICVVDLVADAGMGKSRLLHEFRQRIGKHRAVVLPGSCSPDGQQTPFLSFIEVVRASFRIIAGEAEKGVAQKLETGLTALGLQSSRNLGLLLHLLGLRVPNDALVGLDGPLIGLRTRELLQQLLEARCRLSPVVLIIEDLHWIDSVSQEMLGKIIDSEAKLRLLLLTTRRPEYAPPWLDGTTIIKLPLEPLTSGDIRHLVQGRLEVDALPEALARQVMEKTEGNPLFAEEMITFLTERGILRIVAGKLDFELNAVAGALPASVQGILTARVDRLAPNDRALLQAASVIGRHFDPRLLASVVGETDIDDRITAMHAFNLVLREGNSDDYAFKHALVRDALYQSLLAEPRKLLHLKIAEEIERRSDNRLTEVAEVLAHHYSQTESAEKAFAYLSMAGSKSLSVYSLDEAATHFAASLNLLDRKPNNIEDNEVADFLVSYMLLLNMSGKIGAIIDVLERHMAHVDRLYDDQRAVIIRHHLVFALLWNSRYRDAAAVQRESSPIAVRLGDTRSKAYSLASDIHVSMMTGPKSLAEFEALKKEAIKAASETTDAHIQNWLRFVIGWEEFHRGRTAQAQESAHELLRVGQALNDPRSTGLGLHVLMWIALVSDSYTEALAYSEQSLATAIAPLEVDGALVGKGCALVMLRRTKEGAAILAEGRRRCFVNGDLYALVGSEGVLGVCKVLDGHIKDGIRLIEEAIAIQENKGYRAIADWYRLFLAEVYLQIISGQERLPFLTLMTNLWAILKAMVTGKSTVFALMERVLENPHFDPGGINVGRAKMILGLLYKIRKNRALAIQHLTEAKCIFSQFEQTPILARVEKALTELRQ